MKAVRLIAFILLGTAAVQAARVAAQDDRSSQPQSETTDPLAKELERCKAHSDKVGSDERCQAAYAESRRRFFTPPKPYVPGNVDMFPKAHNEPLTIDQKQPVPPPEK